MIEALHSRAGNRSIGSWLFMGWAVLVALMGVLLLMMGARLAALGGSWYYAMAGAALVATGALLARGLGAGVWLLGATALGTLAWAWWEVGYDGWALVPRLAWLAVVGLVTAAFWPVARRVLLPFSQRIYLLTTAALPVVMGVSILVPLLRPTTILLADPALAGQRPAGAFSRGTVFSPDANVAANHDAGSWTAYAGSNLANHYTPSGQITRSNVAELQVAWHYRTGDLKEPGSKVTYASQNTPLKIGDLVYVCTPT